jgi:PLP dependent protein
MAPVAETTDGSVQRLADARAKIAAAAKAAGRDPTDVELIVVSKTFGAPEILPLLQAGHRVFGENRVQEAKGKWPELKAKFPDLKLHLIGPLQSNKAKEAVELFDTVHTIDRPKIARALAEEMAKQGKPLQLFIQVNTGEEPQKGGVMPGDADAFIAGCGDKHGLAIEGLMCIPPADEPPSPHFALLAKIAKRNGLKLLSMGMSADFEAAIQLGATHVRVGSAIFGTRG